MADDIYTPDERRLLEAWLDGKTLSLEDEYLLGKRPAKLSITHIFSKRIGELQILLASFPRS